MFEYRLFVCFMSIEFLKEVSYRLLRGVFNSLWFLLILVDRGTMSGNTSRCLRLGFGFNKVLEEFGLKLDRKSSLPYIFFFGSMEVKREMPLSRLAESPLLFFIVDPQ